MRGKKSGSREERQKETERVYKARQEAKTSRRIWGRRFSTKGKFYLYMKYFMAVLLGKKIKVPSLKYYSAYRGKTVTTQSFISFLPETVPDGAM